MRLNSSLLVKCPGGKPPLGLLEGQEVAGGSWWQLVAIWRERLPSTEEMRAWTASRRQNTPLEPKNPAGLPNMPVA